MSQTSFIINISTQITCITLSVSMIVYCLFKRHRSGVVYAYLWVLLMILRWSFGQLLQAFAFDTQSLWVFEVFKLEAMCYIGLGWLIFCIFYTENKLTKNKILIMLLFIPPTVSFVAALTNDLHHLFYPFFRYSPIDTGRLDFGVLSIHHAIVSYGYSLVANIMLIRYLYRRRKDAMQQFVLRTCAAGIPFLASFILNADFIQPDFDITPAAFTVALVLYGIDIIKYKFLDIIPIALKNVVDYMEESIMVIDSSGNIVKVNPAFIDKFNKLIQTQSLIKVSDFTQKLIEYAEDHEEAQKILDEISQNYREAHTVELKLIKPQKKVYLVNIRPFFNERPEHIGTVISLNDISEYKMLLEELNKSNMQLLSANEHLKEHALTVESLAIERERIRFARDAHDSVGHSMTLLITLLKLAQIDCKKNPEGVYEKLTEALQISKDGLNELRRSVRGMQPQNLEEYTTEKSLELLVQEFRNSSMKVELSVRGSLGVSSKREPYTIYRICQEALTNALRHGKAKNANIFLQYTENFIKIYIFDNGVGCDKIQKGFGLTEMENRIRLLGGSMICGSGEDGGFNINVEIPIGGQLG